MATNSRKNGKPVGRKVIKKTTAKRQTVKAKPKPKSPVKAKGHRGIVAGTKKEQIAKLYDEKGRDAAIEKGLALELKETTLKSWIGAWKREDKGKGKPEAESNAKAA